MAKKIAAAIIAIVISVNLISCRSKDNRHEAEFLVLFNTLTKIVAYNDSKDEFSKHSQMIYDLLKEYHELYDIYNDYEGKNNIKTINDSAGTQPVKVDRKIIDLLLFSKEQYYRTDGKTNIALGSVLKIWHKYRTEGIDNPEVAKLPTIEELKAAADHTDINKVIIDEKTNTVYLADPKMSLDVGAIGKGFATQKVAEAAKESGFTSGLISVGGNVCAVGGKNGSEGLWNIGVQDPGGKDSLLKTLYLKDFSVVTSGIYERYYTVEGKSYHHIIDPVTLFPSEYFVSVTIVCKDSGVADSLSTAIFNMPYEQGKAMIEALSETYALWVFRNDEIKYSKGFEKFFK